jgi:hypothetical protein
MGYGESTKLMYRKRDNVYKNSTGTCMVYNFPDKKEVYATSYRHWHFLKNINGLIVFNNYSYSNSTSAHQSLVKELLYKKIKIDVIVNQRQSLSQGIDLHPFYETKILCEIKLSKKGLRDKTKKRLEYQIKTASQYIEKLVKAKIVKAYKKYEIDILRSELTKQENARLNRLRDDAKDLRDKKQALKSEMNDFSPVQLEQLDAEMNNLNQLEIK